MSISGLSLAIPVKYYPRLVEFITTRQSALTITPVNYFRYQGSFLFTRPFLFFALMTVAFSVPLISKGIGHYYFSLATGFFISYCASRFHAFCSRKEFKDKLANRGI